MSQPQPQTQSTAQPAAQPQTQQQAQEILQNLERDCQDKIRELNNVRESLAKSQESVIAAQDAVFRSFQLLTINKERYLANIINQLQSREQTLAGELSKVKQRYTELLSTLQKSVYSETAATEQTLQTLPVGSLPTIEERSDNL